MLACESKKRLLVTASTFPRFEGDTEARFVFDLCRKLTRYFDVTVLVPADPDALLEEKMAGVSVIRYRYAPLRKMEKLAYPGAIIPRLQAKPYYWPLVPMMMAGLFWAVIKELSDHRYDVVHAHWLMPQGIIQSFISLKKDAPPYVVTSHGGDIHSFNHPVFLKMFRWVVNGSSALTVVSSEIKTTIKKKLRLSDALKIDVVSMGADFEHFNPKYRYENWHEEIGLALPVFLFVGRIAEKKGLKFLIEAFATPIMKQRQCSLLVVGDGPLKKQLQDYVKALDLSQKINFLGGVNHNELKKIYASADVLCVPSITAKNGDAEGLPTVIIESAASGIPCIASRSGGISDIVHDNETGLLVEQKSVDELVSACIKYIETPELRKKHGLAARALAKNYDWNVIAEKYAKVINQAIQQIN
mgnify:FL=1